MTPEALSALGYTGAGALVVKLLDMVIRWRSSEHVGTLAEMEAARKIGTELRDELRKQLEELRSENVILETKLEACEKERMELKVLVEKYDNARKDAEAELRLLRKANASQGETRDDETQRRVDFEKDQKRKRP